MQYYYKASCISIAAGSMLAIPFSTEASIAISGEIATPEYWTSQQPQGETVLLNQEQIQALNASIRARSSSLRVMTESPGTLTKKQTTDRIYAAMQDFWAGEKPTNEYVGSHLLSQAEWDYVRANCNTANIPETVTVRYAVTTQRGNIRLLPTSDGWYSSPNDVNYDDLQGTAIDPAQAVAVLATSKDNQFYFIQSSDYEGWIDAAKIAFTDYKTWLTFAAPKNFVVVTDHKKRISAQNEPEALYQMGAVIPCTKDNNGHIALYLPIRNEAGELTIVSTPTAFDDTLHIGYLPYSTNTTIRQAFRFLGDVYGWGGQNESVDCSAFVQAVYRSMGIYIPRDQDQQEIGLPKNYKLNGLDTAARYAEVKSSKPGDLFFKPGHVMMYLGTDAAGTPIVIHAASSYFDYRVDAQKHYIRQVIVSDLTYQNASGIYTIDGMSSIGSLYSTKKS